MEGRWKISTTIEHLHNDQNSYNRIYGDSLETAGSNKAPRQNMLGGPVKFNPDNTGTIKLSSFFWKVSRDSILSVGNDTSNLRNHNTFLLGDLKVIEVTDSTAIFYKDISGNGRWTRTFYLKKDSLD